MNLIEGTLGGSSECVESSGFQGVSFRGCFVVS